MAGKISAGEKRRKYRALLARDGNFCFWCEVEFSDVWPFTIDHLLAQAAGGTNRLENLVLACDWCNNLRGHMPAGEFRHYLRKHYVEPEFRSTKHMHPDQVEQRSNREDFLSIMQD